MSTSSNDFLSTTSLSAEPLTHDLAALTYSQEHVRNHQSPFGIDASPPRATDPADPKMNERGNVTHIPTLNYTYVEIKPISPAFVRTL